MPSRYDGAATASNAIISQDGLYRYSLARWWDNTRPRWLWIMCNPSTADAKVNDATIRRCIGFSKAGGAGGLVVVNAYAYRATKPAAMWAAAADGVDIVGPGNDGWITAHATMERGPVVVAWGAHPRPDRVWQVRELLTGVGRQAQCLGTTKAGQPRHPLMLPNSATLTPWEPRNAA